MKKLLVIVMIALTVLTAACTAATTADPTPGVGLANPASVNCTDQGGQVSIETDGSGGQYGVCLFDDNMQCEEWAMLRGECPVGGIRVTGYVTAAATFCAISGGTYAVTGKSGAADETGTCTFASGVVCTADEYYDRTCSSTTE